LITTVSSIPGIVPAQSPLTDSAAPQKFDKLEERHWSTPRACARQNPESGFNPLVAVAFRGCSRRLVAGLNKANEREDLFRAEGQTLPREFKAARAPRAGRTRRKSSQVNGCALCCSALPWMRARGHHALG